jgi:Cd2+/Zn2+-exporting ATPase
MFDMQSIATPAFMTEGTRLAGTGRTVIPFAVDREVAGLFVLEDMVRPEAKSTIARLTALGIHTILITGDNRQAAERVGAELGIAEVHADVLPADKVAIVKQLQVEGHKVAFVGDGINDGPALATADVGIAMGLAGTDLAIETAAIALLADDLTKIPQLLLLSRRAIGSIKQNLVFSLGVLTGAVGLTIVGILTPVTGALVHELSSIPVIANSVRLIGVREQHRPDSEYEIYA